MIVRAVYTVRSLHSSFGEIKKYEFLPRSPELSAACEVWKEIKFEFETIDKL